MSHLRFAWDLISALGLCLLILVGMFVIYTGEMDLIHRLIPFVR